MTTAFQHPGAAKEAQRLIEQALATGASQLDLSGLRLRYLPEELWQLAGQLTSLDLTGCRALTSLDGIGQLTALTALDVSWCDAVTSLGGIEQLTALTALDVSGCDALTSIAGIEQLTALTSLDVSGCNALTSLAGIEQLTALTSLALSGRNALTNLAGIKQLTALTSLRLSHALTSLAGIEQLSGLTSLIVNRGYVLTSLAGIEQLRGLNSLILEECYALTSLAGIEQLSGLTSLIVTDCFALTSLACIEQLTALTSLSLHRCNALSSLDGIKQLTALTFLKLSWCDALTNLAGIEQLTALTSLDVSMCDALTSLAGIELLTALTSLDVSWCKALTSLVGIEQLTALTSLSLHRCNALTSLDGIKQLTALTFLKLSWCDALTNLAGIEQLTALTSLDVSECNALTSLAGIGKLTALTSLSLSECKALTSLAGIEQLTALTSLDVSWCDALTNLAGIEQLTALTSLRVTSCHALTSLAGIEQLTALTLLDVGWCDALTNLAGIEQLTTLRFLVVSKCHSLKLPIQIAETILLHQPALELLTFGALTIQHVPPELTSNFNQTAFEDWWHAGKTHGFAPARQLKVMLLGNGRIGKTQLARRLRGEMFDDTVPSTHGIQLHTVRWQQLFSGNTAVDPADADLQLHCWDFGGQDVYLGTHSLFLDDQAVYLLLWHPDSENTELVDCEALKIRNRPLSYWLAYLKSLVGENANILVCQSQCDSPELHQNAPVPNPPPFKVRSLDISSKTPDGLEQFYPVFKQALKQQLTSNNEIWLPQNWLAVEQGIRQFIIEQPALKQLPYDDFVKLCSKHQVAAPATLANYLHQSGVVFYRAGHFANQLILDQQWALQGVYLLLERQQVVPELQARQGKFEKQSLQRWMHQQQLNPADLPLFLEMMQQCGACFEVSENCYIAPDNLPAFNAAEAERIWRSSAPDVEVMLHYTFLHDATMRYLLSKIGAVAKQHAYYWRYGCCFYDVKHQCTVWFDCHVLPIAAEQLQNYSQPGEIRLRLSGENVAGNDAARHNTAVLAKHLIESITEASHLGQLPTVQWLTGQPPADDSDVTASVRAGSGRAASTEPFAELGTAAPPPNTPAIYFSYAWGDETDNRQITCDAIYQQLTAQYGEGRVARDRQKMRPGDSIAAFEREIARGGCVLLIISHKYLMESLHCMKELACLYEASQRQQNVFCDKVVPVVLADAQIDKPVERLKIVKHWQQKRIELDDLIKEVGAEAAGKSSVDELEHLRAIENSCANALAWISDLVTERQTELQVEATLQLVQQKIAVQNHR